MRELTAGPRVQVARAVKRRAFSLLRIKKYVESMADGIQILRYKQKQALHPGY